MEKKTEIDFYYENKMKDKYKIFNLLPALCIVSDRQCEGEYPYSFTAWELYFEWLWFSLSVSISQNNTLTP